MKTIIISGLLVAASNFSFAEIAKTTDAKCALIGMFAEKAAIARDAKQSIYTAFSKETPWNEIEFNSQKAIILMTNQIGVLIYSPPRIVGEKMYSECKKDPGFLLPLISTFPNK